MSWCSICGLETKAPVKVKAAIEITGSRYVKPQKLDIDIEVCHTCLCHLPDLLSGAMVLQRIIGSREVFRYILPHKKVMFKGSPLVDDELDPTLEELTAARVTGPSVAKKRKRRSHEEVLAAEAAKAAVKVAPAKHKRRSHEEVLAAKAKETVAPVAKRKRRSHEEALAAEAPVKKHRKKGKTNGPN